VDGCTGARRYATTLYRLHDGLITRMDVVD
jgi:hypothetical protein